MSAKMYFLDAILSNVDKSIFLISLPNDYEIIEIDEDDLDDYFKTVEFQSYFDMVTDLGKRACINNDTSSMFLIRKTYDEAFFNTNIPNDDHPLSQLSIISDDFRTQLMPLIQLMRLYKEGNITIDKYYIYPNDRGARSSGSLGEGFIQGPMFTLTPEESDSLMDFVSTTNLPFKRDYIDLAFKQFELSYQLLHDLLEFLALSIGIECIFNTGGGKITYQISRNLAVLLGSSMKDAERIQQEMKRLYNTRSRIIHSGVRGNLSSHDILLLRDYLRRSIKTIIKMDMEKQELTQLLNRHDFGNKVWSTDHNITDTI